LVRRKLKGDIFHIILVILSVSLSTPLNGVNHLDENLLLCPFKERGCHEVTGDFLLTIHLKILRFYEPLPFKKEDIFYIFLIIFFTTQITLVSSYGSISTLSKNLFTDSRKTHLSFLMIFLSLGSWLWTTNT